MRLFLLLLGAALVLLVTGCSSSSTPSYFPLDAGRWWQYRATVTILDETVIQKAVYRNLGPAQLEGRRVFVREQQGAELGVYEDTDAGLRRVAILSGDPRTPSYDEPEHYIIRAPVAPGTSWDLTSRISLIESRTFEPRDRIIRRRQPVRLTYTIEDLADEVSVPAGRFERCLRIRGRGHAVVLVDRGNNAAEIQVESTDWYAPGVGLVLSTRKETSESTFLKAGEYRLELERLEH